MKYMPSIGRCDTHQKMTSDGSGLDFSGFGRARAFMYRASGGPGFFVSGFGPVSGFFKAFNTPIFFKKLREKIEKNFCSIILPESEPKIGIFSAQISPQNSPQNV